ncbi:MAG: hypothetical protein JNK34_14445, partial [Tabrizicola sp.]|nr:hypothetical protein [Tabrizicola sp.]
MISRIAGMRGPAKRKRHEEDGKACIDGAWRERLVGARDGALAFGFAPGALADDSI